MKSKVHNIDNKARIIKYVVNRAKGLNKKESAIAAGYSEKGNPTTRIEKTQAYQEVVKEYYKDKVLGKITLDEIADEQIKVIRQDKDLNAKNTAIKNVVEKIEPDDAPLEENDQVLVILRPTIEAEAQLIDPASTQP